MVLENREVDNVQYSTVSQVALYGGIFVMRACNKFVYSFNELHEYGLLCTRNTGQDDNAT